MQDETIVRLQMVNGETHRLINDIENLIGAYTEVALVVAVLLLLVALFVCAGELAEQRSKKGATARIGLSRDPEAAFPTESSSV